MYQVTVTSAQGKSSTWDFVLLSKALNFIKVAVVLGSSVTIVFKEVSLGLETKERK